MPDRARVHRPTQPRLLPRPLQRRGGGCNLWRLGQRAAAAPAGRVRSPLKCQSACGAAVTAARGIRVCVVHPAGVTLCGRKPVRPPHVDLRVAERTGQPMPPPSAPAPDHALSPFMRALPSSRRDSIRWALANKLEIAGCLERLGTNSGAAAVVYARDRPRAARPLQNARVTPQRARCTGLAYQ